MLSDSYQAWGGRRLSVNFKLPKKLNYKLRRFANKELSPHFVFGLDSGDREDGQVPPRYQKTPSSGFLLQGIAHVRFLSYERMLYGGL